MIFANLKPGVTAAQGTNAITPLLSSYPTAKLQNNAQYKADQTKNLDQMLGLIYALLIFAVIIAFIGIANTLALSIYERTREIGLLRSVGMGRRQVRSMIRWESVIIALIGTLLGLVIGVFFGWCVVEALRNQGINKFDAAPATLFIIVLFAGDAAADIGAGNINHSGFVVEIDVLAARIGRIGGGAVFSIVAMAASSDFPTSAVMIPWRCSMTTCARLISVSGAKFSRKSWSSRGWKISSSTSAATGSLSRSLTWDFIASLHAFLGSGAAPGGIVQHERRAVLRIVAAFQPPRQARERGADDDV